MSNLTEDAKRLQLETWNSNLANELLPDTVFLGIYCIIGLTGNSLVLYIYLTRFKKHIEDRFFIPVLAAIDLIACCVNTSFSTSINLLPVRYDSDIACKIMWFFAMSTTGASAYTLLVIAIHRYQKVCKPFGRQMSLNRKKLSILIILIIVLILSVPCFAFYGSAPVESSDGHVTGRRCTSVTSGVPTIAIVYKGLIFLTALVELVILSVLYTLVGKVLLKQTRVSKQHDLVRFMETSATTESTNVDKDATENAITVKTSPKTDKGTIENELSNSSGNETITNKQEDFPNEKQLTHKGCAISGHGVSLFTRKIPGYRLSLIFIIITAIFIVCFIPKLALMVYESRKKDFWLTLSPSEMGGFRFLYTFFIINNIVNPFIYGFLDKKFQKELKSVCSRKK